MWFGLASVLLVPSPKKLNACVCVCLVILFVCLLTLLISRVPSDASLFPTAIPISSLLYFLFQPAWKEFAGFFCKIIITTVSPSFSADRIAKGWGCLYLPLWVTLLLLGSSVFLSSKMGVIILAGFHKFLCGWSQVITWLKTVFPSESVHCRFHSFNGSFILQTLFRFLIWAKCWSYKGEYQSIPIFV